MYGSLGRIPIHKVKMPLVVIVLQQPNGKTGPGEDIAQSFIGVQRLVTVGARTYAAHFDPFDVLRIGMETIGNRHP